VGEKGKIKGSLGKQGKKKDESPDPMGKGLKLVRGRNQHKSSDFVFAGGDGHAGWGGEKKTRCDSGDKKKAGAVLKQTKKGVFLQGEKAATQGAQGGRAKSLGVEQQIKKGGTVQTKGRKHLVYGKQVVGIRLGGQGHGGGNCTLGGIKEWGRGEKEKKDEIEVI